MKRDDIKTLFVVLIISVICITLVMVFGRKNNYDNLTGLTEYNEFFSVVNFVNDYVKYVSDDNDNVYYLLYSKFISKNNITKDNVLDYISSLPSDINFSVKNMERVKLNRNNYLYFVSGKIIQNNYDGSNIINDKFNIIVLYDNNKLTKAVYPINDSDDTEKIINGIRRINIKNNNYNDIKKVNDIKNEQICSLYLMDFVNYLDSDINYAYDLLSNEMKEKYTTSDSFSLFINNNKNNITLIPSKCYSTRNNKERFYSVIDKNGNKYDFTENAIMNYNVYLSIGG